jgi:thioredoxin 1
MKLLISHIEFEKMIGRSPLDQGETIAPFIIIWFSASWCGPCQQVNGDRLVADLPKIEWLKCDIDQNNYTPGYCGVRSIPTFIAIADKKILGKLQSSSTDDILRWATILYSVWKEDQ